MYSGKSGLYLNYKQTLAYLGVFICNSSSLYRGNLQEIPNDIQDKHIFYEVRYWRDRLDIFFLEKRVKKGSKVFKFLEIEQLNWFDERDVVMSCVALQGRGKVLKLSEQKFIFSMQVTKLGAIL